MKKSILILTILFALIIQLVSAETMCEFDFFVYKNNTVEFIKARSYIGNPESAEIKSSDYGILFINSSGYATDIVYLPVIFYVLEHPMREVDSIPLSIRRPCNSNWDELQMIHNNTRIFNLKLKNILCNNDKVCNNYENVLTCPSDCPSGSKDGWCDKKSDSVCDPDCIAGDPDCKEVKSNTVNTLVESKETLPVYCNNNNICEIYENEVNCPSDCKKKTIAESRNITPKTKKISQKSIIPEKIGKEGEKLFNIGLMVMILLIIIFLIMFFRIKRKK